MAKANRTSKKVVTGVTQEGFNTALSNYAVANAMACKRVAQMDVEITRVREKYTAELEQYRLTEVMNMEVIETYCKENKAILFNEKRSMETAHGIVGFRLGMPKLKTLPKFTWDKVLEKLGTIMPEYIRVKKEVDKEALLAHRGDNLTAQHLQDVGVYVDQDEAFFIELKKEEPVSA